MIAAKWEPYSAGDYAARVLAAAERYRAAREAQSAAIAAERVPTRSARERNALIGARWAADAEEYEAERALLAAARGER